MTKKNWVGREFKTSYCFCHSDETRVTVSYSKLVILQCDANKRIGHAACITLLPLFFPPMDTVAWELKGHQQVTERLPSLMINLKWGLLLNQSISQAIWNCLNHDRCNDYLQQESFITR